VGFEPWVDIGLGKLNGLEAANRSREVAPEAAIIFLTENTTKTSYKQH